LLELLSQYGIGIFLAYLFLLGWICLSTLNKIKSNSELTWNILMSLICFAGVSMMPSGFLILDINWMFVAVLVVVCANFDKHQRMS